MIMLEHTCINCGLSDTLEVCRETGDITPSECCACDQAFNSASILELALEKK